jgi:hypothetical protein
VKVLLSAFLFAAAASHAATFTLFNGDFLYNSFSGQRDEQVGATYESVTTPFPYPIDAITNVTVDASYGFTHVRLGLATEDYSQKDAPVVTLLLTLQAKEQSEPVARRGVHAAVWPADDDYPIDPPCCTGGALDPSVWPLLTQGLPLEQSVSWKVDGPGSVLLDWYTGGGSAGYLITAHYNPPGSIIPEPTTWMPLLSGFGLVTIVVQRSAAPSSERLPRG